MQDLINRTIFSSLKDKIAIFFKKNLHNYLSLWIEFKSKTLRIIVEGNK